MSADIFDFSWIPSSGTLFNIINQLNRDSLKGAEIGVRTGSNVLHILRNCPKIDSFLAIDPFCAYQDGGLEVTQEDQDLVKQILIHRINRAGFANKVQFLFKTSDDAVEDIEDESLDFVFIDGDHSEAFFKRDLYNFIKKVRVGGIISGHDVSWEGVNKVLAEFLTLNPEVQLLSEQQVDSWFFIKPADIKESN